MVFVAVPRNSTDESYLTVSDVDVLCGGMFSATGFECRAVWESGAIGHAFLDRACGRERCECERDAAAAVETSLERVASRFGLARPRTFRWIAGSDLALVPRQLVDGTFVWIPGGREGCRSLEVGATASQDGRDGRGGRGRARSAT